MSNNTWHELCILRDDVQKDNLNISEFAADLYAIRTGTAPDVYRQPYQFFERTYPTHNLKTLARDVLRRLAGHGGNPVTTLQVAYGGGKTHALLTLLHLAENGTQWKEHHTVQEFMGFSGLDTPPRARVAILPFDKFDVKNGFQAIAPDGTQKTLKTPWGALAYQLAGNDGLATVAAHENDYIEPAQPTLANLIRAPQNDGLATLILLDETLRYTRGAVNDDPKRHGILQGFFQHLTQAVEEVNTAAIVASLITSDMIGNDPMGIDLLQMLVRVFRRLEKNVEPVSGEDVAELLRRRFFERSPSEKYYRPVVNSLIAAREQLGLRAKHTNPDAYQKLMNAYPFSPDLIEIFHQKWTRLNNFQGTRGMFRTFATLLRDGYGKDSSSIVTPTTFLTTGRGLSEATQELIRACEDSEKWTPLLTGELDRAREIQNELSGLKAREIEAAVLATFLHSQPFGQKAETDNLLLLLAHPNVDKITLERGLEKWRNASWFLREIEGNWALGIEPNLTHMHFRAMQSINEDRIHEDLMKRIIDVNLEKDARASSVRTHKLPQSPKDISPDTPDEFRFIIAGPEYAATPGESIPTTLKPFFDRTYKNNIVILTPDKSALKVLRQRIQKIRAWQILETWDDMKDLSPTQKALLQQRKREDETGIQDSIIAAYNVLISLDEDGDIKANLLPSGQESPFERAKKHLTDKGRLLTTTLAPELLTPESYFNIWGEDETSRPVQGLYGMFASVPRLPRMLNRQVFNETLRQGVIDGQFVLRTMRPDKSQQTYWREAPATDEDFKKKELEIVPIEYAELHNLSPELLLPGQLPNIWQGDNVPTTVGVIREFFDGDEVPKLVSDNVLLEAIQSAVQNGLLMARRQGKAYLKEAIPDAGITNDLELLTPLEPISGSELSHKTLPDAWENETSSVGKIMHALSVLKGSPIPWSLVVDAVNDARDKRLFEFTDGSPSWPCAAEEADKVGLKVSEALVKIVPNDLIGKDAKAAWESGNPTLGLIKETLESNIGTVIPDHVFLEAARGAIDGGLIVSDGSLTDDFYHVRVRQAAWVGHTESHLTETEIQDLAEAVADLAEIAPELDFKFRISITAEGEPPSNEVLEKINEALQKVTDKLKFD
ncbi:MAG: DUF499 domain-containing protein [Candidatus Poribacteria bacterium]|nr:DUF499 domain-containing protein [Candidatus Poribacteria bacterium]